METLLVRCPNCSGITEVEKFQIQAFCRHCGTALDLSGLHEQVEYEEEFLQVEDQLLALKQIEAYYYHGQMLFDEALAHYDDAEKRGLNHFEFWLDRARFYAAGNIREFEAGRVLAGNREAVVGQYVRWIEHAIANFPGNTISLKMEKEKTIGEINNCFTGRKRREENEARLKAKREEDRQTTVIDEAEQAVEELEEASLRKRKNLIIIISAVIFVILALSIFLRSCSFDDPVEETELVDPTNYELFLEILHILSFFENASSRADIVDLDLNFGNRNTAVGTIIATAPEEALLERINFHFDADDYLMRIVIENADYFNRVPVTSGISNEIFSSFEVTNTMITSNEISAQIQETLIVVSVSNDSFRIEASPQEDTLTTEQLRVWNLIEERIADGYETWSELMEWAVSADINFAFMEDDERPIVAIEALIMEHGLIGRYIAAQPGFGSRTNSEEVILQLHFENLTYNEMIAELSELNQMSLRELTSWLENGGTQRLAAHFGTIEIVDVDEDGEVITEMPDEDEAEIEFISWEIAHFDPFAPVLQGRIRIEREFYIEELEEEEEEYDEELDPSAPVILGDGTWVVGTDVAQGRFVITADSVGSFSITRNGTSLINEVLGVGGVGINSVTTYLLNGDVVSVNGIENVTFTPVLQRMTSTSLGSGHWIVGVDIARGMYNAWVPQGGGSISVMRNGFVIVNQILEDGSLGFGQTQIQLDLEHDDIIFISGVNLIIFN